MNPPQFIASRWVLGVLAALFFALWFGVLETRALFWPDEGRYAEVAREMAASGDYVTPRLNYLKYFEKPPLQYWASAVAFRIFGPDNWSARLWPATTGFLVVIVSAALWWRWRGPAVGVLAGAMLASAWGIVFGAQILTLDMGLALFLSLALLAFVGAHRPGLDTRARAWAITLVWAMMALAVLSKGLVGIVLPGLVLGVYAAVERDAAILRSAFTLRGVAVFLAITLPWFILVQRTNPEFFNQFFVREHFQRYLEPGSHRPGAWWYFLPLAAAFLLPWTGALPGALRDAWRAPRQGSLRVERLLLIWAVVVIAFFSVSSAKLPLYILPALPAIVWLIALSSPARHPRIALGGAITSGIAGVAMVAFATQLGAMEKLRDVGPGLLEYPPFLAAAGGTLLAAGALMWVLHRRVGATTRIVVLAAANLVALQILLGGAHVFDAYFSAENAIGTFVGEKRSFPPEPPFYSVGMLDQTVFFYLGRPVTVVAQRGELSDGITAEPDKYIEELSVFESRWRALDEAYAVMSPATYRDYVAAGLPMTVMAQDPRRVFVARGRWPPATKATARPGP